ncbi:SMC5-SMC6 complex localization factor protein 2 isoform X2 [Simochromis diagramma]|uniref:SMC5-SMC6 complex localization factor protein 2 isoform X2 n=1 Tax=Simochromis diagramma TaxID=43689 RepID=UPI001A7EB494|nr:SMC5-SMC6 complex localization factor protein 2 isoform X2 [Simochromis diagramma]
MKPSQVPNRLSNPPPRRMLPIQAPEVCYRDRIGPHWQNPHPPGLIHSSGFNSSISLNLGSPVERPYFMPKERLGPPEHFGQPPGLVPNNPGTIRMSFNPPIPGGHQPGSFDTFLLPVAINQSPSSHIGRDQATEFKASSSSSESKTVTTQRQESDKAQSSDVEYSIPTVQLHRPSVSVTTPSFNYRGPNEVHPQSPSYSQGWYPNISHWPSQGYHLHPKPHSSDSSRLPIMHISVASSQSQQQEQTPSSEKLISVDLNFSSYKRCSEYEYGSENAKKPCPQGANSNKTETTKPTVPTALVPQPSVMHSSESANQHKTIDGYLLTEQARGQSACSELSSTVGPSQSCCKSSSHKECTEKITSTGAKESFINYSQCHVPQLKEMRSHVKPNEGSVKKTSEQKNKRDKSSTLFNSDVPQKDTTSSSPADLGSHHSGFSSSSSSVKTPKRSNPRGENRKLSSSTHKSTSKPNSSSLIGRTGERNKASRSRRPVASYDANDLFTPDPVTYIVSSSNKTVKPKIDGETSKTTEKGSSSIAGSSSNSITESSCEKHQNCKVTGPLLEASSTLPNTLGSFPTVTLTRVKLENLIPPPRDKDTKNSPIPSSHRQLKGDQNPSLLCKKVSTGAVETDSAAAEQTSTSSYCQFLPLKGQESKGDNKQINEEDPIDVELDLGLSFAVDVDLTQSSHSSDDEQLLSLEEMMERATKPPDTPEKGTFSDPSPPRRLSSQSKNQPFQSTTKSGNYKNNLDQILKEINNNKKSKEIERQLLTACEEDLLKIAEYEEAEENREEGISSEQQEFLQRYSLMSAAIKEVPPGEEVFNLEKFGQIFDQNTLQLRQCLVNPQGTAQKTLLWSSPAQLRLHVNIGLFQEAYDSSSPCPAQVTRFLFKMMSVHSERMISEKLLQALCDIALTAAYQIVKYGNQQFKVWVPSLSDVTLVLMNMGVPFVKLFPFENLQPPFTEGDLLEDVYIKSDSPTHNKEETTFPEHNCSNVLKYLSYCMGLCPRAYSDNELLLILTVMSHIGLETRLILESSVALEPLLCKIVNNIRDWDALLPKICLALTDLTDDHHNMCLLVHLLPDNIRGKELRRHLSLCMISKLLDGNCKYKPVEREFQLSELRPYLPRMQPSSLFRHMTSSSGMNQKDKEEDLGTLDQQSYYLCYSLLTLANEASNFQFFPAHQKKQLLFLSTELETHVKCDIRESEKCLYRSKVKDLVARIYTKWQMLLQRTRPLDDKLYDYWQPGDTLGYSQEEQEDEDDTAEEETVVEEEVEGDEEEDGETTITEQNEAVMVAEEKIDARVEPEEDTKLGETEKDTNVIAAEEGMTFGEQEDMNTAETEEDMNIDEVLMEEDGIPSDISKTEEEKETVPGNLNQVVPETDPQAPLESEGVDEQVAAPNIEHVDEDTEIEERKGTHPAPTAGLI